MTSTPQPRVHDVVRAAMRLGMKLGLVDVGARAGQARDAEQPHDVLVRVYLDGGRLIDEWITLPDVVELLDWAEPRIWRGLLTGLMGEPSRSAVLRHGKLVIRKHVAEGVMDGIARFAL